MKILGVGLSRTGTSSLHSALQILGFKCLHFDEIRLNDVLDGSSLMPDFRRYDDFDAVLDLPTAYFYDELTAAYPDCKCILTVRNIEDWWKSVSRFFNDEFPVVESEFAYFRWRVQRFVFNQKWRYLPPGENRFRIQLRNYVYGSSKAHEYLYKKKYVEHNERVVHKIAPERLLTMDITAGDGWSKLCPFLGVAIPSSPFPHENRAPK